MKKEIMKKEEKSRVNICDLMGYTSDESNYIPENDGGCELASPGRGDCEHFHGLPDKFNAETTCAYGKPNVWCWSCWKSYQITQANHENGALEAEVKKLRGYIDNAPVSDGQHRIDELQRKNKRLEGELRFIIAVTDHDTPGIYEPDNIARINAGARGTLGKPVTLNSLWKHQRKESDPDVVKTSPGHDEVCLELCYESNRAISALLRERCPDIDTDGGMPVDGVRKALDHLESKAVSEHMDRYYKTESVLYQAYLDKVMSLLQGELSYDKRAKAKKIIGTMLDSK